MRILVVEDEVQLAEAVARGLRREGMAVDVADRRRRGYRKAALTRYDVVVLDRDLPGMSGDDICRRLSDEGVLTRVMMLTASGTVEDKVVGPRARRRRLPGQAVRVRRAGRPGARARPAHHAGRAARAQPPATSSSTPPSARSPAAASSIDLTRKEFGVLETLLMAQGAVVSSEELLDRVWDENADPFTTTVRVTMMTLRRKLGEPAIIDTVVGSGYRIDPAVLRREREGA